MLRCLLPDNYANTQQVNRAIIWLQQIQPWLHFLKHYCTRPQIFKIRRSVSTTGCYCTHSCCWNSASTFTHLKAACCIAASWDDECKVKKLKLAHCKPLSVGGELEVKLPTLFYAALEEIYQSATRSVRLCLINVRGHLMGWLGPTAGLYTYIWGGRKFFSPSVFEPQSLGLPACSPHTRYASVNNGGYVLRNASLGDFIVVRTSYSVLTQTYTVYPTTHLGYMV